MENIIVELCIGSTGAIADFMLPAHVPVQKLIKELTRLIQQVYQETCFDNEEALLYDMIRQRMIPSNLTLAQAGIRDSHKVMIV